MTKELVLKALQQAYFRQKSEDSVLYYSDRGSQYASHDYQKQLQKYEMTCSMSRKGNYYDNACIESFHGVKKRTHLSAAIYKAFASPTRYLGIH
ncbi:hypothetical protein CBR56_20370 [Bacillus thuringiensis]|uniref:DDE-type integrase/transposase/recombinase n=1 Tax=Bacillus tropicus TaxID=2026188 RepID=UPI000B43B13F|nr:DDE-type integrase/transposase/recombinase [Bacillus tropicus]MED3035201.1 DDE-type integrase/transposase/recombinase [Bacillus tropicus]OTX76373.1 hypothetical protein BK728_27205 [Bacillus thuringiensis serovar chanpaisis]PNK26022.1 hypothetical protein CBR56_20370 [Bacillus thuringiensis]